MNFPVKFKSFISHFFFFSIQLKRSDDIFLVKSKIFSDLTTFFFISLGLQYAYLNGEENSGNKKNGENENDLAKGARSEITLDELDDLYRSEEAEKEAELASKR